jgi:hypothetical protein
MVVVVFAVINFTCQLPVQPVIVKYFETYKLSVRAEATALLVVADVIVQVFNVVDNLGHSIDTIFHSACVYQLRRVVQAEPLYFSKLLQANL